jgi:hypothetical protein
MGQGAQNNIGPNFIADKQPNNVRPDPVFIFGNQGEIGRISHVDTGAQGGITVGGNVRPPDNWVIQGNLPQNNRRGVADETKINRGILMQVQDKNQPAIDLNKSHGSKSWSMGVVSTSIGIGQELQMVSELRTEGAYRSIGHPSCDRSRARHDLATYARWLASYGLRTNILGSPLRPRFSNRLQSRTISMEVSQQLHAKRIQQIRNLPSQNRVMVEEIANINLQPPPPDPAS